jgi:hypothetical protein
MTATPDLPASPRLSLVLATIGRPAEFARFLDALEDAVADTAPAGVELILVDQDAGRACTHLLAERGLALTWRAITSARGAGAGRAAGVEAARGEILAIPNDNCWYQRDVLSRVLDAFAAPGSPDILSGRLLTADGRPSALRWAARGGPLTRRNWMRRSTASTLFFRRAPTIEVGSFDPSIGTGSAGAVQAGEETDLLLRLLAAGYRGSYDPAIAVFQEDQRDQPTAAFVAKMHGYGIGQGSLWRTHHLSRVQMAWLCGRKMVGAVIHAARGQRILARADCAFLSGWLKGFRAGASAAIVPPHDVLPVREGRAS